MAGTIEASRGWRHGPLVVFEDTDGMWHAVRVSSVVAVHDLDHSRDAILLLNDVLAWLLDVSALGAEELEALPEDCLGTAREFARRGDPLRQACGAAAAQDVEYLFGPSLLPQPFHAPDERMEPSAAPPGGPHGQG